MKKYNQRLYRICKGYCADEDDIEEIMQEAYIKAYQNLATFVNRSAFSTWLCRIAINECLQRIKKIEVTARIDDEEDDPHIMNLTDDQILDTGSLNRELKQVLEKNIQALPDEYRMVFILHEV